MINLVPISAKKKLLKEYWVRVLSVWGMLWASALLLGVVALLPAYVIIGMQVNLYQDSADSASEKIASFETVSRELLVANRQSKDILDTAQLPLFSTYLGNIEALEGEAITMNNISMQRTETGGFGEIGIKGVAADRQSLAALRDTLLAETWIEAVDLPLANLAQDRDISFTITVTTNIKTDV